MAKRLIALTLACLLAAMVSPAARAAVVGVNVVDAGKLTAQESASLLSALQAAGVKTVRVAETPSALPFVTAAYKQGIGTILIVPFVGQEARMRPADTSMGLSWKANAYSAPDTAGFSAQTGAVLSQLDAAGVRLTALEFGNEINNAQFNGDFSASGGHRVMDEADITNPTSPETQAIHDGFLGYIAELKLLNQLRAASSVNRQTPIISAGLADPGKPGDYPHRKLDAVAINSTLKFLRANGLDSLVQGYGVHVYPSENPDLTEAQRAATLEADTFAACTTAKPCWLTEWGFNTKTRDCPLDDSERAGMVQKTDDILADLAGQGRLAAAIYYSWSGHKGVNESPEAIFRCGALTQSGSIALKPF